MVGVHCAHNLGSLPQDVTFGLMTNGSAIGTLKKFAAHDQAMYPEGMRMMFFINSPATASGVWKMISPLLDPVVREKIHIYGTKVSPQTRKHTGPKPPPCSAYYKLGAAQVQPHSSGRGERSTLPRRTVRVCLKS